MREIELTRGLVTIVDDDVHAWASTNRWYASPGANTFYAVRSGHRRPGQPRERFALHRLIVGLAHGDPREADHIDRDGLNNLRENLRVVTKAGNAMNRDNRRTPDRLCAVCSEAFHPHSERSMYCSLTCFGRRPGNPLIESGARKLGLL